MYIYRERERSIRCCVCLCASLSTLCTSGSKALYDNTDGSRAKLFLFVRVSCCIRGALQTIMGSWFAADFGAKFAINDEGGRDFVSYCTKHLIQVVGTKYTQYIDKY